MPQGCAIGAPGGARVQGVAPRAGTVRTLPAHEARTTTAALVGGHSTEAANTTEPVIEGFVARRAAEVVLRHSLPAMLARAFGRLIRLWQLLHEGHDSGCADAPHAAVWRK